MLDIGLQQEFERNLIEELKRMKRISKRHRVGGLEEYYEIHNDKEFLREQVFFIMKDALMYADFIDLIDEINDVLYND